MKEIKLGGKWNKIALVDDDDYDYLMQWSWVCTKHRNTFYAVAHAWIGKGKNITIKMHSTILGKKEGFIIDHKDGNGLNNQKNNIRFSTPSQNMANRKPYGVSGYKGVTISIRPKRKIQFYANITVNHEHICLGSFPSLIEAAKAYDKAAKFYWGDFAYLNFPDNG